MLIELIQAPSAMQTRTYTSRVPPCRLDVALSKADIATSKQFGVGRANAAPEVVTRLDAKQ